MLWYIKSKATVLVPCSAKIKSPLAHESSTYCHCPGVPRDCSALPPCLFLENLYWLTMTSFGLHLAQKNHLHTKSTAIFFSVTMIKLIQLQAHPTINKNTATEVKSSVNWIKRSVLDFFLLIIREVLQPLEIMTWSPRGLRNTVLKNFTPCVRGNT